MAMQLDMSSAGPYRAEGETSLEAERRRAFAAARRHTLLVKAMRFALPLIAVAVVGIYSISLLSSLSLSVGNVRVGQVEVTSEDLTMRNPSYFGTTQDGGRYEVRAKKAILEFNQNAPVKLLDIDGDMTQASNVKTAVRARRGLFDNNKGELTLYDGIEIDSTNGMKARLSEATIFQKENKVVSKKPVHMTSPTGEIRGNTMTLNTATNQAVFLGQVNVRLAPAQTTQAPQKPATSATPAFGRDSKQPIDVRSERFDLDDVRHVAMFTGEVVATQGDSVMRTPELMIAYEGKAAEEFASARAPGAGSASTSGVSRLYARSGVVVTMGQDRRISGDVADFDAKADTALFTGNVLITQGRNTLQGKRLWLERKTGRTRLDAPGEQRAPPGRIAATFFPEQSANQPQQQAKAKPGTDPAAALAAGGAFKTDPNAPMDIDAENLEVLETQHQAAFRGAVKAQQGDFIVKAPEMVVFFAGQGNFMTGNGSDAPADRNSQISRIEARNKVVLSSKEGDTATGDKAVFDVKGNSVLLLGNVSVVRANEIGEARKVGVKGERLKIDLNTGTYRFENDEKATAAAAEAARVPPPIAPKEAATKTGPESLENRPCPPGRQCLFLYPKEVEEKAKQVIKSLPAAPPAGWEPSTSASPVQRGN